MCSHLFLLVTNPNELLIWVKIKLFKIIIYNFYFIIFFRLFKYFFYLWKKKFVEFSYPCFRRECLTRLHILHRSKTVIMQHDFTGNSPVFLLCEGQPSTFEKAPSLNFVETLPTEMSVKIFGELDMPSLCQASQTCRQWRDIIEDSEQLWRQQCLLVRAVCQREVDKDRRDGMSWKVLPVSWLVFDLFYILIFYML